MSRPLFSLVLGCLVGGATVHGWNMQDKVSTRRLEVVDQTGRVGVLAESGPRGPRLVLSGPKSSLVAEVGDKDPNARLFIAGAGGESLVSLSVSSTGDTQIVIGREDGTSIVLGTQGDDGATIRIRHRKETRAELEVSEKGSAIVLTADAGSQAALSVFPGGSKLEMRENDKVVAHLGFTSEGAGLKLSSNGTERVKVLSLAEGAAGLAIYDESGRILQRFGGEDASSGQKEDKKSGGK